MALAKEVAHALMARSARGNTRDEPGIVEVTRASICQFRNASEVVESRGIDQHIQTVA